jgi:hypothetical protein
MQFCVTLGLILFLVIIFCLIVWLNTHDRKIRSRMTPEERKLEDKGENAWWDRQW